MAADPEATFEGIYNAYQRDVLRYCCFLLRDPDEGVDVAGEAFVRAFDAWRQGRGPKGAPLPWLLLIARRLVVDRHRRQRLSQLLHLSGPSDSAARAIERSEFWLWLDALASVLSDRQREVIYLRYRRELDDAEIGELMGLTQSGVRSLVARALAELRRHPNLLT